MKFNLRLLYLYLFSFVGLLITIIGGIQIVDLTLKTYVFKVSNYTYYPTPAIKGPEGEVIMSEEEQMDRQARESGDQNKRQLSNSLAMIVIGTPLYLYHWNTIKKESKL